MERRDWMGRRAISGPGRRSLGRFRRPRHPRRPLRDPARKRISFKFPHS